MADFNKMIVAYFNTILAEDAENYEGSKTEDFWAEFETEGYSFEINAIGYFSMTGDNAWYHFDKITAWIEKGDEMIDDCYELPESIVKDLNERFEKWSEKGGEELRKNACDDWCRYETESSLMSWGRM